MRSSLCFICAADILEGQDLPAMDAGGTSDPYCEVYCCDGSPTKDSTNSSERLKTKVVKKTLHPIFNERFVFGVQCDLSEMRQVVIDVYDSDHIGRDDMGTVTIDMQEIEQAPLKVTHLKHSLTNSLSQSPKCFNLSSTIGITHSVLLMRVARLFTVGARCGTQTRAKEDVVPCGFTLSWKLLDRALLVSRSDSLLCWPE